MTGEDEDNCDNKGGDEIESYVKKYIKGQANSNEKTYVHKGGDNKQDKEKKECIKEESLQNDMSNTFDYDNNEKVLLTEQNRKKSFSNSDIRKLIKASTNGNISADDDINNMSDIKPKETVDTPTTKEQKKKVKNSRLEQAVSYSNNINKNANKKEKEKEVSQSKNKNSTKTSANTYTSIVNNNSNNVMMCNNNQKENQGNGNFTQRFKEFSDTFINFKKGFFKKVHEIDAKIDQGITFNKKKFEELVLQIKNHIPININLSNFLTASTPTIGSFSNPLPAKKQNYQYQQENLNNNGNNTIEEFSEEKELDKNKDLGKTYGNSNLNNVNFVDNSISGGTHSAQNNVNNANANNFEFNKISNTKKNPENTINHDRYKRDNMDSKLRSLPIPEKIANEKVVM